MAEKIIKQCCRFCIELGVNCLGCVIASEHPEAPKFKDYCDDCIAKGECIKKFQNMKDRNICWILSDEDKEIYRKENPEFDAKLKEQEKKEEDETVDNITDEDIARMERLIALKKKKQMENKDGKTTS